MRIRSGTTICVMMLLMMIVTACASNGDASTQCESLLWAEVKPLLKADPLASTRVCGTHYSTRLSDGRCFRGRIQKALKLRDQALISVVC